MYCYHCGKKINEHKIEATQSSFVNIEDSDENTRIAYICPRCGHLIHEGLDEEDSKELSRASHAQIQRGNNSFATGMALTCIGVILLVIGIMFYLLAKKPSAGFVLQTNCAEFYVFLVLTILSVILLGFGITKTVIGIVTKRQYTQLLKDLNNKTFVQ